MTKSSPIVDRITRLQQVHTWMTESEARHLLTCGYAAFTNAYGYKGEELHDKMEEYVENIMHNKRSTVIRVLRETGGLFS